MWSLALARSRPPKGFLAAALRTSSSLSCEVRKVSLVTPDGGDVEVWLRIPDESRVENIRHLGLKLFPGSEVLADWALHTIPANANVIELGSGVGLASIALAKHGVAHGQRRCVIATEHPGCPEVLANLKANAALNGDGVLDLLSVVPWDWRDPLPESISPSLLFEGGGGGGGRGEGEASAPTYIIGSDLVYTGFDTEDSLAAAMDTLLPQLSSDKVCIYLVEINRPHHQMSLEYFRDALAARDLHYDQITLPPECRERVSRKLPGVWDRLWYRLVDWPLFRLLRITRQQGAA